MYASRPSSSSRSCASTRALLELLEVDAGRRVEVDAQLVGVLGVGQRFGHTWNPRQPRFTPHSRWARSAATRASLVVPFGVDTTVVVSQSGADFGTRFWKNDFPPAPSG